MSFHVEVLDQASPNLAPLLTIWRHVSGENLASEQDRARQPDVERFASLAASLEAGESTLAFTWKHVSPSVLVVAETPAVLAFLAAVGNCSATVSPYECGGKSIALVSAPAESWRVAVAQGTASSHRMLSELFSELYRSFSRRGYASLWRDYAISTQHGRLLLEQK